MKTSKFNNQPKDSLCWYCKRLFDGDFCTWLSLGKPVNGWKTEDRRECVVNNNKDTSYTVIDCPCFIESNPFTTLPEFLTYVGQTMGFGYTNAHSYPDRAISHYIDVTGTKPPQWVYEELRRRKSASKMRKEINTSTNVSRETSIKNIKENDL